MSLLSVVRSGVAIANKVTKPLQGTVSFERYLSQDAYGTRTYEVAVSLLAIIDWSAKSVRTSSGELTASRASITFLDIVALNAATDGNGVSDEDVITLPDGTTGPIIDLRGFIDAGTGHPVATEALLG
mgnify:CR=1 FL=1